MFFQVCPYTDVSKASVGVHAFSNTVNPVIQNPGFDGLTICALNLNIDGAYILSIVKVF